MRPFPRQAASGTYRLAAHLMQSPIPAARFPPACVGLDKAIRNVLSTYKPTKKESWRHSPPCIVGAWASSLPNFMRTFMSVAVLLCLSLVTGPLAYGQTSPLYLGIKGGISIPNLTSGSSAETVWDEGYSSRVGPNVGLVAEFPFSPLFSLQPEIDYIGEGGKRRGIQPFSVPEQYLEAYQLAFQTDKDYVFADYSNVSRINYLQIPVMGRFNFPLDASQRLKFFVQAGPFISFLVGARQIVTSDDLKVYLDKEGKQEIPSDLVHAFFGAKLDTTLDAKDQLHKVNVGVQGSMGLSLDCGPGKVFVEGGGNYGFIDIQKGDEHGKNRIGAATVALGYSVDLRRRHPRARRSHGM